MSAGTMISVLSGENGEALAPYDGDRPASRGPSLDEPWALERHIDALEPRVRVATVSGW